MNSPKIEYSKSQLLSLVVLRVLIGWHLLYEGIVKLLNPDWSAESFLRDSKWILSGFLNWIADSKLLLQVTDFLNVWGLILIGLGLMTGFLTRTSTVAGILLIGLYYLAAPPLTGLTYMLPPEGSYMIVNKNLIEIAALVIILFFPTSGIVGLDRIVQKIKGKKDE